MGWGTRARLVWALTLLGCGPLEFAPDPDGAAPADLARPADAAADAEALDQAAPDAAADLGVDAGAQITCAVMPEVAEIGPLEPLVLAGPPGDAIQRWTWRIVAAPEGARPVLAEFFEGGAARPDFIETPEITFRGDRAGEYRLSLEVVGQGGAALCPPIAVTVRVRPPAGLYLQLTWTSPFDPCEACDGRVDLDLLLAPRDLACWGRGSAWTARPGDPRDWPPLDSPVGDPAGTVIVEDAAGLEALGILIPPEAATDYSVAVLGFDLTVDQGGPGPPAEWPADAVVSVFWDGRWIGEFTARLTTTGEVQHLLDVRTCVAAGCVPRVEVVGRASVWGVCSEE